MYRYKRILVNLDFGDQDITLIRYAAMITRMAKSEEIYFLHVTDNLEIPEAVRREYPVLLQPPDEFAQEKMEKMILQHFDGHGETEFTYEVLAGRPLDELLRQIRQNHIDLVIVDGQSLQGGLAEKLARKAPCSVLTIPPGASARVNEVLVAVDFSEHSAAAVDVAVAFAAAARVPRLHTVHVYRVPAGYHKAGISYQAFAAIMHENAEENFKQFISPLNLKGLEVEPHFVLNDNTANAIQDTLAADRFDLLVLGARGRGAGATVLLGSVTERLIQTTKVPLLAVKKKGEGLSLLEALFEF